MLDKQSKREKKGLHLQVTISPAEESGLISVQFTVRLKEKA